MELISVVKDEEAALAKAMEAKLLKLPPSSGVLFVGVSVQAETRASPTIYRIWIGCSRDVDPRMIPSLVDVVLYKEIKEGHEIRTEPAQMGSIRKTR